MISATLQCVANDIAIHISHNNLMNVPGVDTDAADHQGSRDGVVIRCHESHYENYRTPKGTDGQGGELTGPGGPEVAAAVLQSTNRGHEENELKTNEHEEEEWDSVGEHPKERVGSFANRGLDKVLLIQYVE
jgi:hypothetical protein